ncbi:MAG: hypothetical protein ACYDHX_08730 [Methanothrix sp.]
MLSDADSLAKKNDPGYISSIDLCPDFSDTFILARLLKSPGFLSFELIFKRCGYNV